MGWPRREWIKRAILLAAACARAQGKRPRARDLGIAPGTYPPGPDNSITDVDGVLVGHTTLIEGDSIRTGVTAVLPHAGNLFQDKCPCGVYVGNAFGKLAGSTQVRELGTLETPIVLTNTLAVGAAIEAVVQWTLAQRGNEAVRSVNAVVGETNDGGLNDIRAMRVRREDVLAALRRAARSPVQEGSVGAGTGTICFGWKGGIGNASRVISLAGKQYRLGVLVQSNFGGNLTMNGVAVGAALSAGAPVGADGSCMIVAACDAPLSGRQCERLAARALFGLARTGSSYSNGSGDFAIAFSTAAAARIRSASAPTLTLERMADDRLSPFFQAALEATEEAVYNSLLQATTVASRFRTVEAIPIDRVRQILERRTAR